MTEVMRIEIPPPAPAPKKAWQSKTVWTNIALAAAPLVPGADAWVKSNPEAFGLIVGVLNVVLRAVTTRGVSWPWSVKL